MINKLLKIDPILIFSTFLLLAIGLVVLYSISMFIPSGGSLNIFWRQIMFVFIGITCMFFFAFFDYQILKSKSTLIYFFTLIILVAVLIFGITVRGTAGWIGIGSFHVQPVEIAKISLIIFLASFISQKKMELGETGRLIASLILCGIMFILVIKQPDFGSAMVLVAIWISMTAVSGISARKILIIILFGIILSVLGWFQLQTYQKDRIYGLVKSGVVDPRGSGYNVIQSMISVGSGGLIGKGIGHGSQSQLNFLPEKHTDFIFASIAEELGLLGSFFILGLYFIIFSRMRTIALNAPDNFSFLIVVGIMSMFFVQIFENIGMNIGIMPVTGIPLPLLSYGGSSMITLLISIGILININSKKETSTYPNI
ncbi:MAG TPA: rod shape-determining protein RodA [Candidatus Moranbacteria bacterium]|nr:rod shape-determining protein RodA [Candidatus Moranbacteria bacterium]HRZ33647.1 rod shape-determining protein RodA [Candidatus Moranbacteria bacterium]